MKYWLHSFLILLLSASLLAAKPDVKTDNIIKAAYIPLSKHTNCTGICNKFSDIPADINFSIQQICEWVDIRSMTVSGKIDIVFIMCPTSAEKLFNRANFHMTDTVRADLHILASESKDSVDLDAGKEPESRQISEKLQKIIDTRLKIIQKYAQDPFVVNTVKEANAKGVSLDKIKAFDLKWINKIRSDHEDEVLLNNISRFLRKKIQSNKLLYTEAFLCDRQGATVGTYPRTSDYWQGDEAKFTKCFDNEETFVSPLRFDKSTSSYAVQVSVPVKDSGQTIGVLVVGLRNI